ncbi:MAG TPA: hypothetical protein ACFE0H_01060 [Elainellaceae cyanobacterium]
MPNHRVFLSRLKADQSLVATDSHETDSKLLIRLVMLISPDANRYAYPNQRNSICILEYIF